MTVLGKQSILQNSLFNVYSILNNILLLWSCDGKRHHICVCTPASLFFPDGRLAALPVACFSNEEKVE